jgi:hypothetical protein
MALSPTAGGEIRNILLSCLVHIVWANPNAVPAGEIAHLRSMVGEVLTTRDRAEMIFDTAVTLWCAIAAVVGDVDLGELQTVLAYLPPRIDDDDIPFAARFLHFAVHRWPALLEPHAGRIAVSVAASGRWLLRTIPIEAMGVIGQIVQNISDEEILALVRWNQGHFLQVRQTLNLIQEGSPGSGTS